MCLEKCGICTMKSSPPPFHANAEVLWVPVLSCSIVWRRAGTPGPMSCFLLVLVAGGCSDTPGKAP